MRSSRKKIIKHLKRNKASSFISEEFLVSDSNEMEVVIFMTSNNTGLPQNLSI